jgi:hypothetical protein
MNNDGSVLENVSYLRHCEVCEEEFVSPKPSARCCGRKECRLIIAEYEDFIRLRFILKIARWAGAPSQQEMQKKYYRQQLREAIEQLPQSADPLYAILCKIIEDLDS